MKNVINSKLGLLIVSLLFFPKIVMADIWWSYLANNTDKTIVFLTGNSGYCIPPHTQYPLDISIVPKYDGNLGWAISLPNPSAQVSCNVPMQLLKPQEGDYYSKYYDSNNLIAITRFFQHPPGPGLTNEIIAIDPNHYKYAFLFNNDFQNVITPGPYDILSQSMWVNVPNVINSFAIGDN